MIILRETKNYLELFSFEIAGNAFYVAVLKLIARVVGLPRLYKPFSICLLDRLRNEYWSVPLCFLLDSHLCMYSCNLFELAVYISSLFFFWEVWSSLGASTNMMEANLDLIRKREFSNFPKIFPIFGNFGKNFKLISKNFSHTLDINLIYEVITKKN